MDDQYARIRGLATSDPAEFQRLVAAVRKKTVTPHKGQLPVIEHPARFKVMNCGRRWGKTVMAAKMAVAATRKPNQMVWWVSPLYRITKRGYSEVLKQLPDGVLAHTPPPETNFDAGRPIVLRFKNGSRMEFYSSERAEAMLGAAVDFVVLDEAARMAPAAWQETISPTLIDHLGRALIISTPRGHNWFYDVWLKGQDPQQTEWMSWTFTTADNPTLPPGEAERMASDMPRLRADQEIYAKWLAAGSSVFTYDDRAVQRADILDDFSVRGFDCKGYDVVLGVDLARTNDYTVLYGCRTRDRRNVYFERMQAVTWPEQKRRIRRAIKLLRMRGALSVLVMIDSTGVGDPIYEDLEADGYDVVGINFSTHKENMVRLLAKDLEENRAFLLDEAQLDEFRNYSMEMRPSGKMTYSAPEGQHDDVVAAKLLQHWGVVNEGFGEVSVLTPMQATEQFDPDDPFADELGDFEDGSDLIDLAFEDDASAAEAVGLRDAGHHRPSALDLMNNPDAWF